MFKSQEMQFPGDTIWSLRSNNNNNDEEDICPTEEPFHYGNVYLYDYQWYHEKFPKEWALYHLPETGPGQCNNCAEYGSVNGVFIGYCANCAVYCYEGSRCRGFMGDGVEHSNEYKSAFDTYLKGVDVTTIQHIDYEMNNYNDDNENNVSSQKNFIEYNENDYLNADPYEDTDLVGDVSVMECHFEGGYNDF
jgi:hypothetical protein